MRAILTLGGVAVAFMLALTVFTEGWARYIAGSKAENRFALYAIRKQVSSGMTSDDLRRVLQRDASGIVEHRWLSEQSVSAWTHLSFGKTATLAIELRDGRVVHAMVECDGCNSARLDDAPPDF
jgi:hypothetical protein